MNLDILYEDSFIIIINKPAGLAVQGGKGIKTSLDGIFAKLYASQPENIPLLVHRLDRDTSGVLLAAKGRESAAKFSKILGSQDRKTVKTYIAICANYPKKNEGIINFELNIHDKIKKSETKYKVLKTGVLETSAKPYSVIELELGTGRMHQIRRHLAMIGCPILGDAQYGNFALNKELKKTNGIKRLLLHASRLAIKEENIDVSAPLPCVMLPFT